jgi:amino acid adenylation domain-containing protein
MVLEEAPKLPPLSASREQQLLLFSAKTPGALERNIQNFKQYLQAGNKAKLADIAYTLQTGRAPFKYRRAVVLADDGEAIQDPDVFKAGAKIRPVSDKVTPSVIFMFSGQGSQYVNMCRDLYKNEETFRITADNCFDIVKRRTGKDLRSIVFTDAGPELAGRINETEFTQPVLFIIEYALARQLMKWGVQPDVMIGHSIGEYVAACISGVFLLEDALMLVIKRGELMQCAAKGTMLSISIAKKELEPFLNGRNDVSLAAVNSSSLCVVSGKNEPIENFRRSMEDAGYACRTIKTSHAFHSYMMDDILTAFGNEVAKVKMHPQQIPFISNLTGQPAPDAEIAKPQYWVDHLRQAVQFSEGIEGLLRNRQAIFIEVGPGKVLTSLVRGHAAREEGHTVINLARHAEEAGSDLHHLLSGMGKIWMSGIVPDWSAFYEKEKRRKVSLPGYSFEKIEYPVLVNAFKMITAMQADKSNEVNPLPGWFYVPTWKKLKLLPAAARTGKRNLVFVDGMGIGNALAGMFTQHNEDVICVKAGKAFNEASPGCYELNPSNDGDYQKLFQSLSSNGHLPDRIIHAWSVYDYAGANGNAHTLSLNTGFYSLLNIVKAMHASGGVMGKEIVLLTNELHNITGDESIVPAKSVSLGLLKVISQEYPTVSTAHIDIGGSNVATKTLIKQLFEEIQQQETGKTVALRNAQRWVQAYDKLKIDKENETKGFRENGTYLITGGLGNLGYALSKYLLQQYKAKIVLVGRTKLPSKDTWEQPGLAAHVKERINRLQELEQFGEVLYIDCNIADEQAFSEAIAQAEEKFGALNGVIHAAGIVDGNSINAIGQLSKEEAAQQFESKIAGIEVLGKAFKNKQPDVCLIISSLSSILGGLGFAAYASANTFMDHYVNAFKEKEGFDNWLSINFDGFAFHRDAGDDKSIQTGEIPRVFEQLLLLKTLPQVIVSKTDLQKRIDDWVSRKHLADEGATADLDAIKEEDNNEGDNEETGDATSRMLLKLWQIYFGKPNISTDDDFFEIGGDSLKALTMIRRIHKAFNVEVSIKDFFDNASVAKLSQYMNAARNGLADSTHQQFSSIPRSSEKEYYKLSSAQKRLFFVFEMDKASLAYNVPQVVRLKGDIDKARLQNVFERLIERQECLRTSFHLVNEVPVQKIWDKVDFEIAHFQSDETGVDAIIRKFIRPFDLSAAPLLRVGLIEIGPQQYFLMVDTHHIVTDGISQGVLVRDFMALYNNQELPVLPLQYRDYAEWQESPSQQERIAKQKDFWLSTFAKEAPLSNLPGDFIRPLVASHKGGFVKFELSVEETNGLKSIIEKENVTMFMVLLSFYNILLGRLSNQEDIVIGNPVAGRQDTELENIIGMFVGTLPLRNYPKVNISFKEFLANVKASSLASFDNQDYPYEELVDELKVKRLPGRNPLFDVWFVYHNFDEIRLDYPGLSMEEYDLGRGESKFDMSFEAFESNNQLLATIGFTTDLFRQERVEKFVSYFKRIVAAVIKDVNTKIGDIELISAEERQSVFNNVHDYTNNAITEGKLAPASYHQERMWFIDKFESGYLYEAGPVYHNIPLILDLEGAVNAELLQKSIRSLVGRHTVLRTRIINIDDRPFQQIMQDAVFTLKQQKVKDTDAIDTIINRPFDLNEPLIRGSLLHVGMGQWKLIIVFHHTIADRYSVVNLSQELLSVYNSYLQGEAIDEVPAALQYNGFSLWQHEALLKLEFYYLSYWKRQLNGQLKALELPLDRPRAAIHIYKAASASVSIPADIAQGILSSGIDANMFLMAAFKVLLNKYCGHEEIVIGTSALNRENLPPVIGPVANLVVLRSFVDNETSFSDYVAQLVKIYNEALQYQAMPFDKLVKELAPEKDMSRTALFDVLYQYEDEKPALPSLQGLRVNMQETNYGYGKYDLNLFLQRNDAEIGGKLIYNAAYSDASSIERFISHYYELLRNLVAQPNEKLSSVAITTEKEKAALLAALDNSQVNYPEDKTIVGLFAAQVARRPQAIAIKHNDRSITYGDLDKWSTRLALQLRAIGVQREQVVGLLTDRCIETIAGMLAILKAGGAYLPIDVDYPKERIDFLISDSRTNFLLLSKDFKGETPSHVRVLLIEDTIDATAHEPVIDCINKPSDLCYVIYTSGTTGRPKGVMIEHRNVVRLLFNDAFQFNFNEKDVWTMFHSHCFDFSVWEIYGALLYGGKLIIIPKMIARDATAYLEVLKREHVTVLNQTPGAFYTLVQAALSQHETVTGLRYVIFGGEALSPARLKEWHRHHPQTKLINMYGITETTVHVTYKEITEHEIANNISNIGKPIPTLSVLLLNDQQQPVPQGITGEMYVGSAGVARGYLYNEELTAKRFVPNPFNANERLYRSGDLARLLASGEMEYIGRMDHQVQLRGFRIELGEIESQLNAHAAIKESVVIAKEDEDDKYLVAYYVSDNELETAALRSHLAAKLPDYMVPSYFMQLHHLPLTSNGKLDKKALPDPAIKLESEHIAPSNKIEEKLVEIWSRVLKIDRELISVNRSFFELGGHSIRAVHLISTIQQQFSVKIELRKIFENSSVETMSAYIAGLSPESVERIPRVEEKEYYPASPAQERMFYQQLLEKNNLAHNMGAVLAIKGPTDIDKLEHALRQLINRHECLRTNFQLSHQGVIQLVSKQVNFNIILIDRNEYDSIEDAFNDFIRPFNLHEPSIMRCGLLRESERGDLLFIDIHHIVCDGIGLSILIRDFIAIYQGMQLTPLELRYVDYAQWQKRSTGRLDKQKEFWLKELSGELARLDLPVMQDRTAVSSYNASLKMLDINEGLYRQVKQFTAASNVSDFMFLLSIYYILLSKMSDNTDILIGTDVVGRTLPAFKDIVGTFVNILPLRMQVRQEESFDTFLARVKECVLRAYDNQDYQIDQIAAMLQKDKKMARQPIVDVHFSFSNTVEGFEELKALSFEPVEIRKPDIRSQYEFKIEVLEEKGSMRVAFIYSNELYGHETMELFSKYYMNIILSVLSNSAVEIGNIEMESHSPAYA